MFHRYCVLGDMTVTFCHCPHSPSHLASRRCTRLQQLTSPWSKTDCKPTVSVSAGEVWCRLFSVKCEVWSGKHIPAPILFRSARCSNGSRYSSVGVVTRLQSDQPTDCASNFGRCKTVFSSQIVQTGSGACPPVWGFLKAALTWSWPLSEWMELYLQCSKWITLTLFVAFVKTFRFEAFFSKYEKFMWTPSWSVRLSVPLVPDFVTKSHWPNDNCLKNHDIYFTHFWSIWVKFGIVLKKMLSRNWEFRENRCITNAKLTSRLK